MNDNWHCYKKERWGIDVRRIVSVAKGNRNQDFDWDVTGTWSEAIKQYSHFKNSDFNIGRSHCKCKR